MPWIHTIKNGCLGVDINAKSIDVIYIKPDGNPGLDCKRKQMKFSFYLDDRWTTGQRKAHLRDIASYIVKLAESLNCAISLESLDFSVKKSKMRNSGSKKYNRMLSGFAYDGIRCALLSLPEDRVKANSGSWRTILNLLRKQKVSRHDQFQMHTVEEVLKSSLKSKRGSANGGGKSRKRKGGKTTSEPEKNKNSG
ncbi:hypothetical protein [Calothrix sp. CCY 0018]|uniref:hypothetical protein n=1 Tax=Calothrix sp. CCY 0018 TaxID=3103864 RepID=UPI0039C5C2CA